MNDDHLSRVIDGDADHGHEAIVLVHGSWTDHASWQFVCPQLAQDHVVAAYHRRAARRPVRARASNAATAMIVLDEMCEERGGLPVKSPCSIAPCQGARAIKGFESERLICEGLADGIFYVTTSSTHLNRASWGCFATSLAA